MKTRNIVLLFAALIALALVANAIGASKAQQVYDRTPSLRWGASK